MSVKLPFLNKSEWPIIVTREEKSVGGSPDDQMMDHLADEFFMGVRDKDPKMALEAIQCLIMMIQQQDTGDTDAM
ncbi:unnamed protein product [Sphagnum balticum]